MQHTQVPTQWNKEDKVAWGMEAYIYMLILCIVPTYTMNKTKGAWPGHAAVVLLHLCGLVWEVEAMLIYVQY